MTVMLATALAPLAFAEPSAAYRASAKHWMREGKEFRAKSDHAGALKKFSAAYSVVPTLITGLAVAQVQVALRLLVEARDTLGEIQRMPPKATESADGKVARDEAAGLLTDVVARIPVVEVRVTGAPAGSVVTLTIDGRAVPASAAEDGWRVDPVSHSIVATTTGRPDQSSKLELKERDRKKIELVFPAPEAPKPVAPLRPVTAAPPPGESKQPTPNPPADTAISSSTTKYLSLAALGTASD